MTEPFDSLQAEYDAALPAYYDAPEEGEDNPPLTPYFAAHPCCADAYRQRQAELEQARNRP